MTRWDEEKMEGKPNNSSCATWGRKVTFEHRVGLTKPARTEIITKKET